MNIPNYILESVLIDVELWGEAILHPKPYYVHNVVEELRYKGVRYDPAFWSERPLSVAERQRWSRALKELAGLGLVTVIVNRAGRTSHVRPTPEGLRAALVEAGDAPDRQDILRALKAAEWATPEHVAVVEGQGGSDE